MELTPVQQELLRSLRSWPFRTLAKSGHSIGKSAAAAVAINWFFDTFAPCAVISTAPTQESVRNILWKEVRLQRQRAGLPDVFIGPAAAEMRTGFDHYALGLTSGSGEGLQGKHDLRMLFIIDEAVGVRPLVWLAFKSMFKPELGHAWLAICNPTDMTSEAYAVDQDSGKDDDSAWRVFSLSAMDHPNIERELRGEQPLIPSAVTLQMLNTWVADWCTILGEHDQREKTDFEWPPERMCLCCGGRGEIETGEAA